MRRAILIAPLALAACGPSVQVDHPVSVPKVVTVERVVTVPCIEPEQVPAAPALAGDNLTGDAVQDVSTVAANKLRWQGYAGELAALIKGCVAKP